MAERRTVIGWISIFRRPIGETPNLSLCARRAIECGARRVNTATGPAFNVVGVAAAGADDPSSCVCAFLLHLPHLLSLLRLSCLACSQILAVLLVLDWRLSRLHTGRRTHVAGDLTIRLHRRNAECSYDAACSSLTLRRARVCAEARYPGHKAPDRHAWSQAACVVSLAA
jgi:hypothetical protein